MLNIGNNTHPGVLPQLQALESQAADKPGQARNAPEITMPKGMVKAGIQPARGERSATAEAEPSRSQDQIEGLRLQNIRSVASYVFVLDRHGHPLMPTHPARARALLKAGRARIHRRFPFVIRLVDRDLATSQVQPITVGVDPGSKFTGLAIARTDETIDPSTGEIQIKRHILSLIELQHRGQSISDSLTQRSAFRRRRRSANLRYRQPRFLNRTRAPGWLPPSLQHRVDTVNSQINRYRQWLPISHIAVENVRFDMQKLVNPEITGVEYQQGSLAGYEVREYLLEKFGRQCVYCDVQNVPLQVEHIHPKAKGGSNRISNLTLACGTCNHAKGAQLVEGFLAKDPKRLAKILAKAQHPLKDAAAVNATRFAIVKTLGKTGLRISTASGGRTKFNRTELGIPKSHCLDAACVGQIDRIHNWQMPVLAIKATGRGAYKRTRLDRFGFPRGKLMRQKSVKGFKTGDMVAAHVTSGKKIGTYTGRVAVRASGSFNIQTDTQVIQGIGYKHIRLLSRADGYGYSIRSNPFGNTVSSPTKASASGRGIHES